MQLRLPNTTTYSFRVVFFLLGGDLCYNEYNILWEYWNAPLQHLLSTINTNSEKKLPPTSLLLVIRSRAERRQEKAYDGKKRCFTTTYRLHFTLLSDNAENTVRDRVALCRDKLMATSTKRRANFAITNNKTALIGRIQPQIRAKPMENSHVFFLSV